MARCALGVLVCFAAVLLLVLTDSVSGTFFLKNVKPEGNVPRLGRRSWMPESKLTYTGHSQLPQDDLPDSGEETVVIGHRIPLGSMDDARDLWWPRR